MGLIVETPINELRKSVKHYNTFRDKLISKEGINPEVSQEKLDTLIKECDSKIEEFKEAIDILKNAQNKKLYDQATGSSV